MNLWRFGRISLAAILFPTLAIGADVSLDVTQERPDGYRAEVTITNPGDKPVTDWSLEFSSERTIERAWGAELSRTGDNRYRFRPDAWTREIAAGGRAKFTLAGPPGKTPLDPGDVKLDAKYAAVGLPVVQPEKPAVQETPEVAPAEPKKSPPAKTTGERRGDAPASSSAPTRKVRQQAETQQASLSPASTKPARHTLAFKLQSSWESGFTAEIVVINVTDRNLKPWRLEFDLKGDITEMWNADFRKLGNGRYAVLPKAYNDEIDAGGFVTFGFKTSTAFQSRPDDSRLSAVN